MTRILHYFVDWKRKLIRKWKDLRFLVIHVIAERSFERIQDENFSPIFLCGMSGSGTTLLSGLLDQDYLSTISLPESDRHEIANPLLWINKTGTFNSLDEYIEAIAIPDHIASKKIRKAKLSLYRRLASYPKKTSIVFDKAPNTNLKRIGKLLNAFPNGKAVLIFRDPIEVIEGLQRKWPIPFGKESVEKLAKFWLKLHQEFLSHFGIRDDRLLIISYQELVDDTEKVLRLIAKKFDLRKRAIPKKLQDRKNIPGKGLRNIVGGSIKIVKNASSANKGRIDIESLNVIETICLSLFHNLQNSTLK